jgi:hypothetical protein
MGIYFLGSRRWGDRAIIDGVYQDAYAYFGSIEKKFSDRHSINLLVLVLLLTELPISKYSRSI